MMKVIGFKLQVVTRKPQLLVWTEMLSSRQSRINHANKNQTVHGLAELAH
jgi:hypothetical protein